MHRFNKLKNDIELKAFERAKRKKTGWTEKENNAYEMKALYLANGAIH